MKAAAAAFVFFSGAASAQISNFQVTDLNTPAASQQAVDAFGTAWIVDPGANSLGRIDLATGAYTPVPVPSDEHALLYNLATTPDGSVWYADYGNPVVGRRSANGAFFRYTVPSPPYFIAGAFDSGVYFSFLQKPTILGHLSADGGSYRQFNLPAGAVVENLTVGPDGAAYFTDLQTNHRIVRVGLDGVVQSFNVSAPNPPASFFWHPGIALGPDRNVWFTHAAAIGRLRVRDGAVTEYPIPYANADASGITAGGDGNIWFADSFAGAGVVSQLVVSTATDDGHATIHASPGIGEPIGIVAVAPEPLAPGPDASGVRRFTVLGALTCPQLKFLIEQNRSTGSNVQSMSASPSDAKCAELEIDLVAFRLREDGAVGLALDVVNNGPDPAEEPGLSFAFSGFSSISGDPPGWQCDSIFNYVDCDRTSPLASGQTDSVAFELTVSKDATAGFFSGCADSSTPDPTPYNCLAREIDVSTTPRKVVPPAAPVVPPVSRKPHSEEEKK